MKCGWVWLDRFFEHLKRKRRQSSIFIPIYYAARLSDKSRSFVFGGGGRNCKGKVSGTLLQCCSFEPRVYQKQG